MGAAAGNLLQVLHGFAAFSAGAVVATVKDVDLVLFVLEVARDEIELALGKVVHPLFDQLPGKQRLSIEIIDILRGSGGDCGKQHDGKKA